MNTVRDLKPLRVWVNPNHLAATALHVMVGHHIKALGVVEGSQLVGVLSIEDLVAASVGATVAQVMKKPSAVIEAETRVRQAAQVFVEAEVDSAPVLDQGKFGGMLTPAMLLEELGRSFDPLTQLSWSDQLREWGIQHLRNNDEVTIIFVDLNHFGLYNKKYGHIIGDKVIAKVAGFLSEQIDPDLDILVRYGGDEFAIGTLRDRKESDALAELLMKRFDGTVEGADEQVSFSTGVFGGRRHKERESVHYARTIDDLINIASRNCIANKRKQRGEEDSQKPRLNPKVLGIFADEDDQTGIITVILSTGGNVYSGADSRQGKSVVQSIAGATVRAIERASPGVRLEVLAIDLLQEGDVQIVSVTGQMKIGETPTAVSAAKRVTGELANAVAEATIEAFKNL